MLLFCRINGIDGLTVIGNPVGPVVAWHSNNSAVDIFRVGDAVTKRGWSLASMHKPNSYALFCVLHVFVF